MAVKIAYTTDSNTACIELNSRIPDNLDGVGATECNNAVLTITLN